MFFNRRRRNRDLNDKYIQYVKDNESELTVGDLSQALLLGDPWDMRPYVAAIGFFDNAKDHPGFSWVCREDGNIWGEWLVNVPLLNAPQELQSKRIDQERILMSNENKRIINDLTHELWAMHKLESS